LPGCTSASEAPPISRKAGVPISLFEVAYWTAAYHYAPLLAAVFAPIAGTAAYLTGVMGRFATERRLRAYGVYEAVELTALLYLLYLTLRPLS
jgi:hypothetical protein